MHAPNPTESHNLTELINEIEHVTKKTNLTVQDVLNVTRHLFYRTRGRGGPLKIRSREELKPLVSKYGIEDRKLHAILQILDKGDVLDLHPRISRPGEKAKILLEYMEQLPPEPVSSMTIPSLSFVIESEPREIHIWEFPHNFRVLLEPNVMRTLIDRAAASVGGFKQLARVLTVATSTISRYRHSFQSTPISILLRLCDLAGDGFAIEQVEPYIIAYKGDERARPILNPTLPIRETPELFAFMGHMTGDGGHGTSDAYYDNTNDALIHEFVTLLREVFGEVPFYIPIDTRTINNKRRTPSIRVRFGQTIIRLLRHLYQVDFRTFTTRVPRRLFELPREYAAAYVRAYADDEGGLDDRRITIVSANQRLIQDVYHLVRVKFPEMNEFVTVGDRRGELHRQYYVRFKSVACADYKKLIGFTHPEKRQRLDRILARRQRGWVRRNDGNTRRMLLENLMARVMTAKDLAQSLDVTMRAVCYHLKKELIPSGFVRKAKGSSGETTFEITESGHKILSLSPIGLLQFGRAGRRRVELLKILVGRVMTAKQLEQKIGIKHRMLNNHLNGRNGQRFQGLVKLGLVKRIRWGNRFIPDVYRLTDKGKQFLEELETHFPKLWNSV